MSEGASGERPVPQRLYLWVTKIYPTLGRRMTLSNAE